MSISRAYRCVCSFLMTAAVVCQTSGIERNEEFGRTELGVESTVIQHGQAPAQNKSDFQNPPYVWVRQQLPPAPLELWNKEECRLGKRRHGLPAAIATFAWFETEREQKLASEFHLVKESTLKQVSASEYFPLAIGRWWEYERTAFATVIMLDKTKNIMRNFARDIFSWKFGTLPDGPAVEERKIMEIETDSYPAHERTRGKLMKDHVYKLSLKETTEYQGTQAFVVTATPPEYVRDGRYGELDFARTLWLKRLTQGITECREVISWHVASPQTYRRVELVCDRPVLFDAGYSQVRTYGPVYAPSRNVLHGFLCTNVSAVSVKAGDFTDTLRFVEHVEPRGEGGEGLQRPSELPTEPMSYGWITISWFARGVGLVKEAQYHKDGSMGYEIELVDYGPR